MTSLTKLEAFSFCPCDLISLCSCALLPWCPEREREIERERAYMHKATRAQGHKGRRAQEHKDIRSQGHKGIKINIKRKRKPPTSYEMPYYTISLLSFFVFSNLRQRSCHFSKVTLSDFWQGPPFQFNHSVVIWCLALQWTSHQHTLCAV